MLRPFVYALFNYLISGVSMAPLKHFFTATVLAFSFVIASAAFAGAPENLASAETFLSANTKKPGVKTTASGLQYQVLRATKGKTPLATNTVRVHYKGYLKNGKVFDQSYGGNPAEFPLDRVIKGWTEGVALMPVGSKYRFWIHPKMGYGETGTPGGPIGPNTLLIFDVELLAIIK
jgi:FKBP-type peptidyl-prolyl cis-trans isomerase FkpA